MDEVCWRLTGEKRQVMWQVETILPISSLYLLHPLCLVLALQFLAAGGREGVSEPMQYQVSGAKLVE